MKLFLDSADFTAIQERVWSTGIIDGVTTNPTLIKKSGKDPEDVYQHLKDIGLADISMEVVGDSEEMIKEGRRLAEKFGSVATIKVPCTQHGLWACKVLRGEGIKVNVTLIFNAAQAILSAKAGATYVSPFIGRLDDNSVMGLEVIERIAKIFLKHDVATEILAASIRDVPSVSRSFMNGADIVTMPPAVFDKMYHHVLTDAGLEQFDKDWSAIGVGST